jgi:hypothetical protein
VASILAALNDSELWKIVVESRYGARVANLGALYEKEQTWAAQPIAASSVCATYCFNSQQKFRLPISW